jgi:limonene-1,2-epoxide hydrolase
VSPALHRAFAEHLPAQRYRDVEAADAPVFTEMRRFLERSMKGVPDVEFALWMVATVAHAVIHNGIVERPDDVASGRLVGELVVLLTRYLKRGRAKGSFRMRRDAMP